MTTLTTRQIHSYAQLAWELAEAGGLVLKSLWGNLKNIQSKEFDVELVTEADKLSEKKIIELLRKECPGHAILAEESGAHAAQEAEFLWIIDPLDGTTNFAHQYPFVSVSIALLHQGTPVTGVVFNPIMKELFQASIGQGATLNGDSLHVSKVKSLSQSLLVTGFPYDRRQNKDNNYAEFCHMQNLAQGIRRAGSAAIDMAYVAAGRCDAYWERGIKPWDVAAGVLIVQEAGGTVSQYDGSPLNLYGDKILATNGLLHHSLSAELMTLAKK